jgi:hypothetical protein
MQALLILIVMAGVFGLVYPFYIKNKFARAVSWTFCAAVGLSLIPIPEISFDGYYLFIISYVLVIIYAFSQEDFSTPKKGLLATLGGLGLLPLLLFISGRPATVEWAVCNLAITGICIFILAKERRSYKQEFGFLVIIAANAVVNLVIAVNALLSAPSL